MYTFGRRALLTVLGVIAVVTISSSTTYADSVVWNTVVQGHLCGSEPGYNSCYIDVSNPDVSVSYNVQVSEVDASGNVVRVLSSGDTVTKGSKVKFSFAPHSYQDISWFATGWWNDTPYGDWTANATVNGDQCLEKDMVSVPYWWVHIHIPLEVAPPTKSLSGISGLGSCTTLADGSSMTCSANTSGDYTAAFNFAATKGSFYARFAESTYAYNTNDTNINNRPANDPYICSGGYNTPMMLTPNGGTGATGPAYNLQVPQQTIPFALHVVDASNNTNQDTNAGNNAPSNPTVSAASVNGGGACIVGTPYSIKMVATDLNRHAVRYGIDWANIGSVNQWVPATGYVPSGTEQTASRTYTTTGQKTVKVLAQNDQGVSSGWTTFTFSCADAPVSDTNTTNTNTGNNGNGNGNNGNTASNDIHIAASPSLVRSGATSQITWRSNNASACVVSGANGDSWTGTSGSQMSSPIKQQTLFTLSCQMLSGTVSTTTKINIIPSFQEI